MTASFFTDIPYSSSVDDCQACGTNLKTQKLRFLDLVRYEDFTGVEWGKGKKWSGKQNDSGGVVQELREDQKELSLESKGPKKILICLNCSVSYMEEFYKRKSGKKSKKKTKR